MISNEELRNAFLTPNMRYYLHKKLAPTAPEEVDIRIEELLKYLNMSIFSNGDIPFNGEIDDVWHFWIMETREYFALCDKLHGRKYIHHSSNVFQEFSNPDIKSKKPDFDHIIGVLVAYVLNYGPFEEARVKYWPLAERIMLDSNWDIHQLNGWLRNVLDEHTVAHA
jgi:hypothetical protein